METQEPDPFQRQVESVLKNVSYKNWSFLVGKDAIGLYHLQLRFVNRENGFLCKSRKWRLSTSMTNSEIVQTALKAVLTAEEHEARESFLYRGKPIFGPHLNIDTLWEIADNLHTR